MSTQAPNGHDTTRRSIGAATRNALVGSADLAQGTQSPESGRTPPEKEVQVRTLVDDTNHAQQPLTGPLAVPPRQACRLLCVGLTRLYELLHAGELESYRHGRSRRITIASIRAYIARQVEASPTTWGPPP